jgi:nucleoside-diphosphate-sugar epimerase
MVIADAIRCAAIIIGPRRDVCELVENWAKWDAACLAFADVGGAACLRRCVIGSGDTAVILVTGAEGLIGRRVSARLEACGVEIRRFDLQRSSAEDICDEKALCHALKDVEGVVHLAAVSRVVWGQRNPTLCRATNVTALERMVKLCLGKRARPWIIFASSREVYGQTSHLPVREDEVMRPLNTYARSKRDGELIIEAARRHGLLANICRFSNVYGCPEDHPDRVVPAFALAAAHGGVISVEGSMNIFDFTFVDEAVDGLCRIVQSTIAGEKLPPIHLVSGRGTTLGELAEIAAHHARGKVSIKDAPPRSFDVSSFVGDPGRAETLLGWRARAEISEKLPKFIAQLAELDG